MQLIARLPYGSAFQSEMAGGKDWALHYGADRQFYAMAAVYDAVNLNTRATGNWKKPPTFDPYPTPHVQQKKKSKKRMSVRDMAKALGASLKEVRR